MVTSAGGQDGARSRAVHPFAPRSISGPGSPFFRSTSDRRVGARSALRGVFIAIALAVVTGLCAGRAAAERAVTAVDLLRLRTVTSVDVSRDGQVAVFAVRSIEPAEWSGDEADYAYRSHLWMVNPSESSAVPVRLTHGAAEDTSPVLSPDGRRIAFLRRSPGGEARAHVLHLSGGEAVPLAALPHGCSAPQWSPDGTKLVVTAPLPLAELEGTPPWPLERPGREWNDEPLTGTANARTVRNPSPAGDPERVRAWLGVNASEGNPLVITRLDFQDERALKRGWRFQQIFIIDAINPDASPVRVTSGFCDHQSPRFMPDGRRLIYVRRPATPVHPDREQATSLWTIAIDGADEQVLLALPDWRLSDPVPSRDGSVVAFVAQRLDDVAARQRVLGLVGPGGGEPIWLTETLDRSVRDFAWMGTTPKLLFTAPSDGGIPLRMISPGLLSPVEVVAAENGQPVGVSAFATNGTTTVYARTSADRPCSLHVLDNQGERQIVDLNTWVRDRRLSKPVGGTVRRPDGLEIDYWVMEPANRRPGQRYPLLLQIHGGPSAMWGPGELSMWHEFQFFCSAGWGIVYANPRGSGGYGYDFQRANRLDWGAGPAGDVLAAVDEAVRLDWVDPERLAVTGGSYGGFLTAWILTRDHRFKAGVAQRGVYELGTFFGEGNAWRLLERSFGGYPFEPRVRDVLDRNSPFLDARRIQTPLMIMHALSDARTGIAQPLMLYRALKALNKPVELVLYPDADHDLSRKGDPVQRIDRLLRMEEFLGRWTKGR